MKKINLFAICLAVFALILYPINDLACVLVMLTALTTAVFVIKDKELTAKVLQPALMLGTLYAIRSVFAIILGIISNFGQLSSNYYYGNLYENISNFNRILSAVCLILVLVYLVLTLVFFIIKKDIPLFGNLSNKILGKQEKVTEKQNSSKQKTAEQVDVEKKDK